MTRARICIDASLPAAEAMARGQALLAGVSADAPVLLYGAALHGASVVLGAYQHAPQALRTDALSLLSLPVLRRQSGGAAVWGGEGVLYLALGLADASALMACPPGRILNRNVRGFLAGARALPVPSYYFGRDFVSWGAEPGAYVGWDEADDGRVLLEWFVGLDAVFTLPAGVSGYPQPSEPPLRGKQPVTLRAAGATTQTSAEVLEQLAQGYARSFSLELARTPPSAEELARAAELSAGLGVAMSEASALCWSDPWEEAIGFVSAGVQLDARGLVDDVRLAGDFFQQRGRGAAFAARLRGTRPDAERIGAALDAVYGTRAGLIEGVRSLSTLRDALLQALERARGAGSGG